MAIENRFTQVVITTLAKRAANQCSNPNCGAITSGPTEDPNDSVNIGEAAHIYGANPGSARYNPNMVAVERREISNAIWLCSNCHKLIDDDPIKYPAGLLFEWQREHERRIAEQIGKVGAKIRQRYEKRHLEEFGRLSYLAERLILEKGEYWEYLLTAEMLRYEIAPVLQRWKALKRGLYVKATTPINKVDFIPWMNDRMYEIGSIVKAFDELTNTELSRTWGEPGIAGSDTDIVNISRLYAEVCKSALIWEETVRFVRVDEVFSEVRGLFIGIAGDIIEEAAKIPNFLIDTLADRPKSGVFNLHILIELPENWYERFTEAMNRAMHAEQ